MIPDDRFKIPFLEELKLKVKSCFGDVGLSICDSILDLLSCFFDFFVCF